jgi:hypothetical protein
LLAYRPGDWRENLILRDEKEQGTSLSRQIYTSVCVLFHIARSTAVCADVHSKLLLLLFGDGDDDDDKTAQYTVAEKKPSCQCYSSIKIRLFMMLSVHAAAAGSGLSLCF